MGTQRISQLHKLHVDIIDKCEISYMKFLVYNEPHPNLNIESEYIGKLLHAVKAQNTVASEVRCHRGNNGRGETFGVISLLHRRIILWKLCGVFRENFVFIEWAAYRLLPGGMLVFHLRNLLCGLSCWPSSRIHYFILLLVRFHGRYSIVL